MFSGFFDREGRAQAQPEPNAGFGAQRREVTQGPTQGSDEVVPHPFILAPTRGLRHSLSLTQGRDG